MVRHQMQVLMLLSRARSRRERPLSKGGVTVVNSFLLIFPFYRHIDLRGKGGGGISRLYNTQPFAMFNVYCTGEVTATTPRQV